MYTEYDRIFSDLPAKNYRIYTVHILYMILINPIYA